MSEFKFNVEIDSSIEVVKNDVLVLSLLRGLFAFHQVVPLALFLAKEKNNEPGAYVYEFKDQTNPPRQWDQVLYMTPDPTDPVQDFTCIGWKESEFALQRPVRDDVKALIIKYGVTKIRVAFT